VKSRGTRERFQRFPNARRKIAGRPTTHCSSTPSCGGTATEGRGREKVHSGCDYLLLRHEGSRPTGSDWGEGKGAPRKPEVKDTL